jgi:hypothetical protein
VVAARFGRWATLTAGLVVASIGMSGLVAQAKGGLDAEVAQIIDQVESMRGMEGAKKIAWRLADADAALTERLAGLTQDPEIVDRMEQDERILVRLGLLPAGTDLLQLSIDTLRSQIVGYYDTKREDLTVIDADGVLDTASRISLAHEAEHALQDQRWDLDGLTEPIDPVEGDRLLAVQALMEGDATLLMTLWAMRYAAEDIGDIAGTELPDDEVLQDLPQVLQRQLLSPYLDGMTFLTRFWGPGGWGAVDRVWDEPPVSTEQILHPERYPDELPVPVALPDLAQRLGEGWTQTGETVMGELNTAVWVADGAPWDPLAFSLGGQVMPDASAADGWGGDRLVTLDGPDGAWALAWQTAWDTPADRSEFEAAALSAMQDLPGASRVLEADLTGSDLPSPALVVIADSAATLQSVEASLDLG